MLISLACLSWAASADLLAAALFTLSALALVSTSRRCSSAAHSAFDMPGGFVFFARIFLAGAFGGIVVDEKTRRRVVVDEKTPPGTGAGRRGDWGISAGENGDMQANWREWGYASKLEGKSTGFGFPVADYAGPHDVSRQNLSSGVPERAPGGRGWRGLAGWMKGQIWTKTRNRGRD